MAPPPGNLEGVVCRHASPGEAPLSRGGILAQGARKYEFCDSGKYQPASLLPFNFWSSVAGGAASPPGFDFDWCFLAIVIPRKKGEKIRFLSRSGQVGVCMRYGVCDMMRNSCPGIIFNRVSETLFFCFCAIFVEIYREWCAETGGLGLPSSELLVALVVSVASIPWTTLHTGHIE